MKTKLVENATDVEVWMPAGEYSYDIIRIGKEKQDGQYPIIATGHVLLEPKTPFLKETIQAE